MANSLEVKRISPLKMLTPLFIFLGIAAIWSVYWYVSLGKMQTKVADIKGTWLRLECSSEDWGGYPFRISYDCKNPILPLGNADIKGDKLRLIIQAWNPSHVIGALFGPTSYAGIKTEGEAVRFSYRESDGKLQQFSLLAEQQTLTLKDNRQLKTDRTEFHVKPSGNAGIFDISGGLKNVTMQELVLSSFSFSGTTDTGKAVEDGLKVLSEPSNYYDMIWVVQRIAKLDDAAMNAADALIRPLLKANDNKLPILRKDDIWYWGPFPLEYEPEK